MAKKKEEKEEIKPSKYIRIASDAPQDEFRLIGERVQRGELKWGYFASDGNKNYHHYLVVKK